MFETIYWYDVLNILLTQDKERATISNYNFHTKTIDMYQWQRLCHLAQNISGILICALCQRKGSILIQIS